MTDKLLDTLNENQRKAVLINKGSLLIFAGAGSGKTRVITTKIAYAIREGLFRPEEILAVTFTNKACDEMKERVANLVGPEAASFVTIKTFHSFGSWCLRKWTTEANLSNGFGVYDEDECVSMLSQAYKDYSRTEIKEICERISKSKDTMNFDALKEIPEYSEYENRLKETNHVDFADLILKPLDIIKEYKYIQNYLHNRFKMILVDEYQDTNKAQAKLLSLIAGPGTFVCAVGDDDQSIYAFRGADITNIRSFKEKFPNTQTVTLGTNYRCSESILEVAKDVIKHNNERQDKNINASQKGGIKPVLYYLENAYEEARHVVNEIEKEGNYDNTAILYRNSSLSRLFEMELGNRHIPYHIVGSLSFYEREEVKDALALISLYLNPNDTVSFERIINKPPKGIGEKTVSEIVSISIKEQMTVFKASEEAVNKNLVKGKKAEALTDFCNLFNLEDKFTLNSELIEHLLNTSGLIEWYKGIDKEKGSDKFSNLEQVIISLKEEQYKSGKEGLVAYLENASLVRERSSSDNKGVTLITMHKTKGLEYESVWCVGLDDGILPSKHALSLFNEKERKKAIEEERRIFYVAITRAKKYLYMTTTRDRWNNSYTGGCPSRFLHEIGKGHIIPRWNPLEQ